MNHRTPFVLFAIAIVSGLTLRLWGLGVPSLWLDEFVSVWICNGDTWRSTLNRSIEYSATPPLFFLLIRPLVQADLSEFWLRLPCVVADVMTITLVFFFCRHRKLALAGSIAALCCAWNIDLVTHARMCRPYSVAILFSVISTFSLWEALDTNRKRLLVIHAVASSLLLYTHTIFAPVLLAQLFIVVVHRGVGDRPLFGVAPMCSFLCTGLMSLGVAPQIVRLWTSRGNLQWATGSVELSKLSQFIQPSALILALTAGLVASSIFRRRTLTELSPEETAGRTSFTHRTILWFGMPLAIMLAMAYASHATYLETRYLLAYAVPASILVGLAIARVPSLAGAVVAVVVYVAFLPEIAQLREIQEKGYATLVTYDLKPSLQYMDDQMGEDDVVLVRSGLIESSQLNEHWVDRELHAYLAAPTTPYYLKKEPPVWSFGGVRREVLEQQLRSPDGPLASANSNSGAVWVLCHDAYGAGREGHSWVEGILTDMNWVKSESKFMEGELVEVYRRPSGAD